MNIVWFRNDLRISDNTSLQSACNTDVPVVAVYCFDPLYYKPQGFSNDLPLELSFSKTGSYRAQFIIEAITDLKENLATHGIPLLIYTSSPAVAIANLATAHHIDSIYYQKEWTRDELNQEMLLKKELETKSPQATFISAYDQFLMHPDDIPFTINDIPQVFTNFRKRCEKESTVRNTLQITGYKQSMPDVPATAIPTLDTLGLEPVIKDHRSAFPWTGGETSAWQRVEHYFWETKKLQYYKKTRNGLIGIDYSSKLSAWLGIGCISPRQTYWEVKRFEKEIKKNEDTYWLIFELLWRDFFKYTSLKNGDAIFKLDGILNNTYKWYASPIALEKWIKGQTKEPFVNANMKELAATGFMSNRGRQNVASYWSMHLEQDWRLGAAYFEHILIDYDVHANYGNWMYNSGVGNDPRNRTFNIGLQASRYDAHGTYQRLWLQDSLF